ncbi:hypothetical protein [Thauera sp.]|uniref:hypothetical protein n=1 Tax=Thauera sp. TaxID=1905334 RepID=UPI0039E3ACAF
MDDVLGGQTISLRRLGLARLAATQQSALMHEFRPGSPMNCAIHATTTQDLYRVNFSSKTRSD